MHWKENDDCLYLLFVQQFDVDAWNERKTETIQTNEV